MDGVAISIIERPQPLTGHNTPNATHNTYTLKCEEPSKLTGTAWQHTHEDARKHLAIIWLIASCLRAGPRSFPL